MEILRNFRGASSLVRGLAVAVLCLAGAGPALAEAEPATTVEREGEAIVYRGGIDADANARVRELLEEGGVRWLHITSSGGELGLGMDLGELVHGHGLDVRVLDYCASSCANYVFPAGRRKLLGAASAVIWHGSAIQADVGAAEAIDFDAVTELRGSPLTEAGKAAMIERFAAYGRAMRERQAAFYAALGVDQRVTVFGQDVACDCEWTVPVADMARFGIAGIEAPDGYGAHLAALPKPVTLLRLDDHPDYAAAIDAARDPAA